MKNVKIFFTALTVVLALSTARAATLTKETANKMMMKSGCITCHSIDNNKIGPAYKEIGARYATPNAETLAYLKGEKPLDYLMKKVRTGTKVGINKNWIKSKEGKNFGMMTPHPVSRISDADLKDLVTFILTQK
jgi:cytochrome c